MTDADKPAEAVALRRKGRPKLQEAADIERTIRRAALDLLMEHGEAATLNGVARAAGVSRKSLYARYASRSDLFIEVIRDVMREPQPLIFASDGPIEQDLCAYACQVLEAVASKRSVTIQRLLAVDPAYIHALRAELRASSDRYFLHPLQDLLVRAVARGEIRSGDHGAVARAIVDLIFAESHRRQSEQPLARQEDWQMTYARFLADLVCNGLLAKALE